MLSSHLTLPHPLLLFICFIGPQGLLQHNEFVHLIALDFSKAFDTARVRHFALMSKLSKSLYQIAFYPRGARDVRVLAVIACPSVCVSVCHTPVLYQND